MFVGTIGLLLVLLVLFVVLGVTVAVVLALSSRPDSTLTSEVASARRHAMTTSGLSLALMLVTPLLLVLALVTMTFLGTSFAFAPAARVVACAPLLGSLAGLLVLLLGELNWPRPTGASRTALLHDRSARSLLTRGWPLWAAAVTLLTAGAVVTAGVLADENGATVTHVRPDGADTAGPFPGWMYGVPQLVTLAACVLVAVLVVRAAARRSAVVTADVETDQLLRRASVARACRALVAGALLTLGPDLVVAGSALHRAFGDSAVHGLATATLATGLLVGLLGFVALLVPVPRLPSAPYAVPPSTSVSA